MGCLLPVGDVLWIKAHPWVPAEHRRPRLAGTQLTNPNPSRLILSQWGDQGSARGRTLGLPGSLHQALKTSKLIQGPDAQAKQPAQHASLGLLFQCLAFPLGKKSPAPLPAPRALLKDATFAKQTPGREPLD